jgi:hypothetical protein
MDLPGTTIGRQLMSRGDVSPGATIVLVRIDRDLARTDANYLKIQRL